MLDSVYLLVVTILLLAALGVSIPVLRNIVRDGRERRRKWKSGEMEQYTEDEEYGVGPPAALDGDDETTTVETVTCPQCGVENSTQFAYCQNCTERL